MARKKATKAFVMCVNNDAYPASLETRKVYVSLSDPDAEAKGFRRVVDDSGEDYLYPTSYFVNLDLPKEAAKVVLTPISGGTS